jgi:hypothetical protein
LNEEDGIVGAGGARGEEFIQIMPEAGFGLYLSVSISQCFKPQQQLRAASAILHQTDRGKWFQCFKQTEIFKIPQELPRGEKAGGNIQCDK